ncbi:MAG: hypothetical protein U0230_28005 [Polyangiales bacterium]
MILLVPYSFMEFLEEGQLREQQRLAREAADRTARQLAQLPPGVQVSTSVGGTSLSVRPGNDFACVLDATPVHGETFNLDRIASVSCRTARHDYAIVLRVRVLTSAGVRFEYLRTGDVVVVHFMDGEIPVDGSPVAEVR